MKILLLDIETAPATAHTWGLFKTTIGMDFVIDSGRVLCWAAKWLWYGNVVFASENGSDKGPGQHKKMIRGIHKLLSEAEGIVHYNGARFDLPTLNKEFIKYDMAPPPPVPQIDLLRTVRTQFRFPSNKLDFVSKELGISRKLKHRGPELWLGCMARNQEAWKEMEAYNRQDVVVLEELYSRLLPWITNHPHVGIHHGAPDACPNCGGTDLRPRGMAYTKLTQYQRYRCQGCGTWTRSSKRLLEAKNRHVV